MARAEVTDPLQSFRFHATATDIEDAIIFTGGIEGAEAGFQSITIGEKSIEAIEYREGTMKYTKKFPGIPSFSDSTLMRGVLIADTAFWNWIMRAGSTGEYRTEIVIWHYHRADDTADPTAPNTAYEGTRLYKLKEALPIRVKPAGDMDSTSGEVSLAEVDVAMEWLEIETAQ